jgi:hypothetical protein
MTVASKYWLHDIGAIFLVFVLVGIMPTTLWIILSGINTDSNGGFGNQDTAPSLGPHHWNSGIRSGYEYDNNINTTTTPGYVIGP